MKKFLKSLPLILLVGILLVFIFLYRNILFDKNIIREIFEVNFGTIINVVGIIISIIMMICGQANDLKIMKYVGTLICLFLCLLCVIMAGSYYRPEVEETVADTPAFFDIVAVNDTPIIIDTSFHSMHERLENIISDEPEPEAVVGMLETSYEEYLQSVAKGEIWKKYYRNYEGNGERQMFAVVEKTSDYSKSSEENGYGTLWYVDKYGARLIEKDAKEYLPNSAYFLENGYIFLILQQCQFDGITAYVWSVMEGEPYQLAISGQGSDIRINEFGDIEVVALENALAPETGGSRMEKYEGTVYYFYLDGMNTLREYGGMEISIGELQDIQGVEDIIRDILNKSYLIDTIYYRDNGIININLSKEYGTEIKRYNATLRNDGIGWQIVPSENGQEYGEGIYLEAMIPSIAVYPNEFPY